MFLEMGAGGLYIVFMGTPSAVNDVARFVSTLAGAYKAFYLYNQDNKAFEEILQNLAKRFQDAVPQGKMLRLRITNRSIVHEGRAVGFSDLTVQLANNLQGVGVKEIILQSPLQGRHFFQIFHILSSKDNIEVKKEKLMPFYWDGDPKPVSLVPITANSLAVRLSDEFIQKRLAPMTLTKENGGMGFAEMFRKAAFASLPDLLQWIIHNRTLLPESTAEFVNNIVEAMRDGYFPIERFTKLFPLPLEQMKFLKHNPSLDQRTRDLTAIQQLHALRRPRKAAKIDWIEWASCFTTAEAGQLGTLRKTGTLVSSSEDLDLTQSLLSQPGPQFKLGLIFLVRLMNDKSDMAVQEKALRIAMNVWTEQQSNTDSGDLALLSSLRVHLCSPNNINLALFPIRTAVLESNEFHQAAQYLLSLGRPAVAPVLKALEADNDRIMRKKLCFLLALMGKQNGVEPYLECMNGASFFLMRNIVLVLGEIKHPAALKHLAPLVTHPQRMVRAEAVRAVAKYNTVECRQILFSALPQITDEDLKDFITQIKNSVDQKKAA